MLASPKIPVESSYCLRVRRRNPQHLDRHLHMRNFYNHRSLVSVPMPKKSSSNSAQILLFPTGESGEAKEFVGPATDSIWRLNRPLASANQSFPGCDVVLSGSFRRDIEGLRRIHEELQDLGCSILSPTKV